MISLEEARAESLSREQKLTEIKKGCHDRFKKVLYQMTIDLNCDVAEGIGNEAELMPWISSATLRAATMQATKS